MIFWIFKLFWFIGITLLWNSLQCEQKEKKPLAGQQKQHFYLLGMGVAFEIGCCLWRCKKVTPLI